VKIIFLDIDGVLTTGRHARFLHFQGKRRERWESFDPYAVKWLNELTESTGACLVVSSVWRLGRSVTELREILKANGVIGHVLDKTPHLVSIHSLFKKGDSLMNRILRWGLSPTTKSKFPKNSEDTHHEQLYRS
jgi:hypothetical protein